MARAMIEDRPCCEFRASAIVTVCLVLDVPGDGIAFTRFFVSSILILPNETDCRSIMTGSHVPFPGENALTGLNRR